MSDQWGPPPAGADIPNNLVIAIVSIFCCWPLAIFAILSATKVNTLVAAGDIAGATEASAKAKKFAMIAIIVGVVIYIISFIIGILMGVLGAATNK